MRELQAHILNPKPKPLAPKPHPETLRQAELHTFWQSYIFTRIPGSVYTRPSGRRNYIHTWLPLDYILYWHSPTYLLLHYILIHTYYSTTYLLLNYILITQLHTYYSTTYLIATQLHTCYSTTYLLLNYILIPQLHTSYSTTYLLTIIHIHNDTSPVLRQSFYFYLLLLFLLIASHTRTILTP